MGQIVKISDKVIGWKKSSDSEPPDGEYTWRGTDSQGNNVYQRNEDPQLVCIKFGKGLIEALPEILKQVGIPKPGGGSHYGLIVKSENVLSFNMTSGEGKILRKNGKTVADSLDVVTPSQVRTFDVPDFMTGPDGIPYYRRDIWSVPCGNVLYYLTTPPARIVPVEAEGQGDTYEKFQEVTLTTQDVRTYSKQDRDPDQGVVMGRATGILPSLSARDHFQTFWKIAQPPNSWHWCHLVAHSMRPNADGQVADNLVAGPAAVNGAMLALESAVKQLLIEDDGLKLLNYEAVAHVYVKSHIAKHIRVRIWGDSWSEAIYFDANTAVKEEKLQIKEFKDRILKAARAKPGVGAKKQASGSFA